MRLMLLGGPGAGKGTQATKLMHHFHIPQISTGDMLRTAIAEGTPLGKKVKSIMDSGQLVSDDIMISLVKDRLKQADCKNGYLLDGFPRTLAQAQAMRDAHIPLDEVIELVVPDEDIIARITGRRVHVASGRVYHVHFHPPKVADQDDVTGEPLIQREDDQEETIKKRLNVYHELTEPLVQYYRSWQSTKDPEAPTVHQVQGVGEVETIFSNILGKLRNEHGCQSHTK